MENKNNENEKKNKTKIKTKNRNKTKICDNKHQQNFFFFNGRHRAEYPLRCGRVQ